MHDANEVEVRAEAQLTRRYWNFLGGISGALLTLVLAKIEATTMAASPSLLHMYSVDIVWSG